MLRPGPGVSGLLLLPPREVIPALQLLSSLVDSYDEEESTDMRRPGMGIAATDRPAFNGFLPSDPGME